MGSSASCDSVHTWEARALDAPGLGQLWKTGFPICLYDPDSFDQRCLTPQALLASAVQASEDSPEVVKQTISPDLHTHLSLLNPKHHKKLIPFRTSCPALLMRMLRASCILRLCKSRWDTFWITFFHKYCLAQIGLRHAKSWSIDPNGDFG